MEYINTCGCRVIKVGKTVEILYCPLHKSAPRMYKALESIAYAQNLIGAQQIARQVLAELEGKDE